MKNVLIFGSNGSIGKAVRESLSHVYNVYSWIRDETRVEDIPDMDVVIWCQGMNCSDTIENIELYSEVIDANLNFVVHTFNLLLKSKKIRCGTRVCIISSIWEKVARPNKFSYTVSKAALGGFVRSVAVDLRCDNILVNSILPGPVDNEMTRTALTPDQIQRLPGFVKISDILHLVDYLCFKNDSMTGQSLVVDLGLSVERPL